MSSALATTGFPEKGLIGATRRFWTSTGSRATRARGKSMSWAFPIKRRLIALLKNAAKACEKPAWRMVLNPSFVPV